jgi:junctophilin
MNGSGSIQTGDSLDGVTTAEEPKVVPVKPVRELYKGEWKNDKRHGYGLLETSDGYKYIGQWCENMRQGLGIATYPDNTKLEGEFLNDLFTSSVKKQSSIKSLVTRFRQRIQITCEAAMQAGDLSVQKSHMSLSRAAAARDRGLEAAAAGERARQEAVVAKRRARDLIQRTPNSLSVPIPKD